MYAYRKMDRLAAQHEHFVACDEKRSKGTKKCVVSEGLTFYTTRPACLMLKQYTEGKCCLRNKNHEVTRLVSIR